jgi:hypothetical protein
MVKQRPAMSGNWLIQNNFFNWHGACKALHNPATGAFSMNVGIFIPIGNNGWLLSENAPAVQAQFRAQQAGGAEGGAATASTSRCP